MFSKGPFGCIKGFATYRHRSVSDTTITFCILSLVSLFSITTLSCSVATPSGPAAAPTLTAPAGWAATYGGTNADSALSVRQTRDGGYIMAGETWSSGAGKGDAWVLKLRPDGSVEWQKSYGGVNWDSASAVQQTADDGYVVAGMTPSFGAGARDSWVLKLRPDGSIEWQKTYGGDGWDEARSIQQTSDGGYIVAGVTQSSDTRMVDYWVLKLGRDGTVEWQKTYGGDDQDFVTSVRQTRDGGYIMTGDTWSFGAKAYDLLVLKLRPDGTIEWQKTYGGDFNDAGASIRQTGDGGYIVAGDTMSFDLGQGDAWVLKLRPDGAVEWQKAYGGPGRDFVSSVRQTGDGGYVAAGWTAFFDAEDNEILNFLVLKLKLDGTVEWQKTYGRGTERAESIQQTRDGGYIVTGLADSLGAVERVDILVLKLRPDGSIDPSCDLAWDTTVSGRDSNAIVKDSNAVVSDTNVDPQDSSATVQDTNLSVSVLCALTAVE